MRRWAVIVLAVAFTACSAATAEPELKTEEDKTLYALGTLLGQRLAPMNLTAAEMQMVLAGFKESAGGSSGKVDLAVYGPKVNAFAQARIEAEAKRIEPEQKKAGEAFLAKIDAEAGVKKTASGLRYKIVQEGSGESPKATDRVKVNYTGKLIDGTVFDASEKHGGPYTTGLGNVVACWTEGLQLLKPGGKATLYCPSEIGYGSGGNGALIKPGATLVFDVELLEIVK